MEYRNEMSLDDVIAVSGFGDALDKLISAKLKVLKFDKHYSAKVIAVYYGTADISLYDSTNIIKNVKVKDGLSLNVGDEIYVLAINGSLNNLIIDIKK
jgi:hypothetical protein